MPQTMCKNNKGDGSNNPNIKVKIFDAASGKFLEIRNLTYEILSPIMVQGDQPISITIKFPTLWSKILSKLV